MADSTLDPDNFGRRDRSLGKGHGTSALGPSDISDSGSDVMGKHGLAHEETIPLDTGTTSDPEFSSAGNTAGPDVGDANLSSDTDSMGTGEHATAGRDTVAEAGGDIGFDQVQAVPDVPEAVDDEIDDAMDVDKDPGWRGRKAQPPSQRSSNR